MGNIESLRPRIEAWVKTRVQLGTDEAEGRYPAPGQWHGSDDEASDIVWALASILEVEVEA
jgi:hypothetical protein